MPNESILRANGWCFSRSHIPTRDVDIGLNVTDRQRFAEQIELRWRLGVAARTTLTTPPRRWTFPIGLCNGQWHRLSSNNLLGSVDVELHWTSTSCETSEVDRVRRPSPKQDRPIVCRVSRPMLHWNVAVQCETADVHRSCERRRVVRCRTTARR
jgi:hypothetical protein